ncbi:MAG: YVTN family beta-propeller repeat-containing protein [Rikenellaceae bacterium]
MNVKIALSAIIVMLFSTLCSAQAIIEACSPLYPTDLVVEGNVSYIASKGHNKLIVYDNGEVVGEAKFNESATGVAVSEEFIFVTTSYSKGYLHKLSKDDYSIIATVETGMGAKAPIISNDGLSVFVCNQFSNSVAKVDIATMIVVGSLAVPREPFAAVQSKDGGKLFVNNFLPAQAASLDYVAADVTVIDLNTMSVITNIKLSNGSNALRDIAITNDGRFVLVSHNLGRFQVPTSQLQQGWMNTNAMSVIDANSNNLIGSVLIDKPERGYAGIWGIATNDDKIFISHSGVHEITIIDYPKFVAKLDAYQKKENLSIDLNFLYGIDTRVAIEGNGPRAVYSDGENFYTVTYFSDHLNTINAQGGEQSSIDLNHGRKESIVDEGERIFNDAAYCFQQWQSCNGCHPGEGRTDGMNWDLMNDNVGNPKNCKSMLYSHRTNPSMISGIRETAELAVRKGFTHIQFSQISEEEACKVDEYLKALRPLPSPHLDANGELTELAKSGRKVFENRGCDECHNGPLFTDQKMHIIGEDVEFEKGWDTPTLIETWRTAPYLFDGRAATMEEVFSVHKHGIEGKISKKDLEALVKYVNSL